ncbi:MAG TPA: response regulator [Bacteroidales bacterium]|jgi:DNA-binding response OmpR family regulator|nr:response regulator [Bacteroidales bacterium]
MKVLIVEDDIVSRELLRVIVQKEGYELRTAEDGMAGFEVFSEYMPDVVITDIRMPRLDGIELLKKIRTIERDTIVIIVTAHGNENIALEALHMGANNYLKKPINLEDLKIILSRYHSLYKTKTVRKDITALITSQHLLLSIESDLDLIPSVAEYLVNQVSHIYSNTDIISIELGLSELLLNAIEHGSFNISGDEKEEALKNNTLVDLYNNRKENELYKNKKVHIEFNRTQSYCEWIITDEGEGFDYTYMPSPFTDRLVTNLHGRGVFISKLQFDSIEYIGKGNCVKARKIITT